MYAITLLCDGTMGDARINTNDALKPLNAGDTLFPAQVNADHHPG